MWMRRTAPVCRDRQEGRARGTNLRSWRTTDASTFESSSAATLCTSLVFACSPLPPPRFHIRHTVLARADWCAVRAVARCGQGRTPVITTGESGSRVFWH